MVPFIRQPDLLFSCFQIPQPADRQDWMVTHDYLIGIVLVEGSDSAVRSDPGTAFHRLIFSGEICPVFQERFMLLFLPCEKANNGPVF